MFDDGWDLVFLKRYLIDIYNIIDLTTYAVFFGTFVFRLHETAGDKIQPEWSIRTCKGLYGLTVFLLYIKVFSFMKVFSGVGPKVGIFGELFSDLWG